MDKLTMATKILLKLIETDKTGFDAEGIAAYSFEIADAMQAEAKKREDTSRPDFSNMVDSPQLNWQPDWSKSPNAKFWAMDADGMCNFYKTEPEMVDDKYWDFGEVLFTSSDYGYQGDWRDSLRKRPKGE